MYQTTFFTTATRIGKEKREEEEEKMVLLKREGEVYQWAFSGEHDAIFFITFPWGTSLEFYCRCRHNYDMTLVG